MKKVFSLALLLVLACFVVAVPRAYAQAKPAPKAGAAKPAAAKPAAPAATASAAGAEAPPAPIALAPETPKADPNALKIKAEINPVTRRLLVKCDAPGPTLIEINNQEGRPVMTKNVINGSKGASMDVTQLPAGGYVVRCTAGEKKGTRLVQLGQ